MTWIFLFACSLFPGVEGIYESIDDITNNLASDLAPLITLFGEQATKQFLSESTSFMDSIIFSIAPLGLITAVVSVIRIYGSSSFKSIIGRSQEAHGVAEAELCSSTSQDVCELWSNGGICRVFGRPKILDFLYSNTNTKDDFYPKYKKDQRQDIVEEGPTCGIYRPNTLFFSADEEMRKKMELFGWRKVPSNRWTWSNLLSRLVGGKPNDRKIKSEPSANPNLTLNIGIRKIDRSIHWSVLTFSVLLQLSFFGYVAWATFYDPSISDEVTVSRQAKVWFGLTIIGTIMLVFGMILCARLIDLKSREQIFKKTGGTSKIFWLQPGGQRIGDQLFHAFAYWENRDEYITSGRVENAQRRRMLLLAVISTTSGWVIQFVGLRGSRGSIALFQFIATLIMSFLRAVLRGKRLEADKNLLEHDDYKILIEGHELDWQAMNMDEDDRQYAWLVSDHFPSEDHTDVKKETHKEVTVIATKNFRAYYTSQDDRITCAANYASEWIAAQEAIEANLPPPLASEAAQGALTSQKKQNDRACTIYINHAAKVMRFRSRLAELTSVQFGLPSEQAWGGEIRTTALQLQEALQFSAEYIFAQFPLDPALEDNSAPKAIAWKSTCSFSKLPDQSPQEKGSPGGEQQVAEGHFTVGFQMYNRDGRWSISSHQLEAVLGLWSWSLKRSGLVSGHKAKEQLVRSKMVVVEKSKRDDIEAALYLWVTQTRKFREYETGEIISRSDNLSIPTSSLLSKTQSSEQTSGPPRRTDTPNTDGFTILGIPTNGSTSLLQLMAQDVYTIFINRIIDIVGDLRGAGDPEDYLTMRDHSISTSSRATPLLELTNPHIDALANALVSAGMASREEALMSIVPAFLHQMKLSLLDEDMIQNLLDRAKSLRRHLKFREGAAIIIWILSRCQARFYKQGLRCLGDLYRRAALSKKRSDQEFGLSGMREMKKSHSALASACQIEDILTCYERVCDVFQNQSAPEKSSKYQRTVRGILFGRYRPRNADEQVKEATVGNEELELALIFSRRFIIPREEESLEYLLKWALDGNFPELVEDLWMSVSSLQAYEKSPLVYALDCHCELETVHSLLDWPLRDVDTAGGDSGPGDRSRTALLWAIKANRVDVVRSILRRGARAALRQCDGLRMKALHIASEFCDKSIVQLLLEEGTEIHEKDHMGRTPLHLAAEANGEVAVQVLLGNGAKIQEKDIRGRTPLHLAAAKCKSEKVTRLLLGKGADMYGEDREGQTVLHVAAREGHHSVLRLLLEKSAEDESVEHRDWTSLWLNIWEDDKEIIQLLKEKHIEKPLDFVWKESDEEAGDAEEIDEEERAEENEEL